jgi:transcriptional regulator
MYIAPHFKNDNTEEVKDFIRLNGFAILVNRTQDKLWASHIPLQLAEDGAKLYGHVARANAQWKDFHTDEEVLAIFTGPHAYISPSWYDHENVPTWNYVAVHIYGKIKIIEGELLYQSLKGLVDQHEKHSQHPVSLENMSAEYVRKAMKGLVGFEITIASIEAAKKLSQNRDHKNYNSIIDNLHQQGDANALEVAHLMKKNIS